MSAQVVHENRLNQGCAADNEREISVSGNEVSSRALVQGNGDSIRRALVSLCAVIACTWLLKYATSVVAHEANEIGYAWIVFSLSGGFFLLGNIGAEKFGSWLAILNIPGAVLLALGCLIVYTRRTGIYIIWAYGWLIPAAGAVWGTRKMLNAFGYHGLADMVLGVVATGLMILSACISVWMGHKELAIATTTPTVLAQYYDIQRRQKMKVAQE